MKNAKEQKYLKTISNPHGYRWSAEFPAGKCYFRTRRLMRNAVRERNEDWRPNGGYVIDANQRLY